MKKPKPQPQSRDDAMQREATRAGALAMVERVKTWLVEDKDRRIRTLNIEHFTLLAGDCIAAWLAERDRQSRVEMNDPIDDLYSNLLV